MGVSLGADCGHQRGQADTSRSDVVTPQQGSSSRSPTPTTSTAAQRANPAPAPTLQMRDVSAVEFQSAVQEMYLEADDALSDLSPDAADDRSRQTLQSGIDVMMRMLEEVSNPHAIDASAGDSRRYVIVEAAGEPAGLAIMTLRHAGGQASTFLDDLVTAPSNVVPGPDRTPVRGLARSVVNKVPGGVTTTAPAAR